MHSFTKVVEDISDLMIKATYTPNGTYKWTHISINNSQIILKFSTDTDDIHQIHDMIFNKFYFS